MRSLVVTVIILAGIGTSFRVAHAGDGEAWFASTFGVKPDKVHDVVTYTLPPGGDYSHVVIGRFDEDKYRFAGAALMSCTTTACQGTRAGFSASDKIEVRGLVDLDGAGGDLPRASVGSVSTMPGKLGKFPALVVVTTESRQMTETGRSGPVTGTETHVRLHLLSLMRSDRGQPVFAGDLEERYPSGAGTSTSYRLVRGDSKTSLDLMVSAQRNLDRTSRCLRPKPVEARYKLVERHYRTSGGLPGRSGCG